MTSSNIAASQALAQQVAAGGSSLLALKQNAETQKAIADVITEASAKATANSPTPASGRGQNVDINV